MALLLPAPALIALLALSPWVVRLLYTNAFVPAVDILRWQLLGDIVKVMSWPLGFVILAAGAGRAFIFCESIALAVYVAAVTLGLALAGIVATGIAFLAMYAVLLPAVYWLARWRIGFRWAPPVVAHAMLFFIVACGVSALSRRSEAMAAAIGLAAAGLIGLYALGRLGHMAELSGPVGAPGDARAILNRTIGNPACVKKTRSNSLMAG